MDDDMRDWFKTIATLNAGAIALVAAFAGLTGSQAFNGVAVVALVFLVVSLVAAVVSVQVGSAMKPGEKSRLAAYPGVLTILGFVMGFALLALYGVTRLL